MKVTEQIDAMRALGTDPMQKLVTPRLIATAVMLPLLTIIADFVGMFGGWVIAPLHSGNLRLQQYWPRCGARWTGTTCCRGCSSRSCSPS